MGKFGQLPKAADWQGRLVRIKKSYYSRSGHVIPRWTVMSVVRAYGGLTLRKSEDCPHCGCGRQEIVDRVPYNLVSLVEE